MKDYTQADLEQMSVKELQLALQWAQEQVEDYKS